MIKTLTVHEEWFSKNKKEPKLNTRHITEDEREMISKFFPSTNAHEKWWGDRSDQYVIPHNVNGVHGTVHLSFYTEDDKLKVSVGWYKSKDEPGNPKARPLTHTDHEIRSETDLINLKKLIES
jgi:hypothetical protein